MPSAAMKSAMQPVWACKSSHAMQTLRVSVTVAQSPVAHVEHSVNSGLARAKIRELAFAGDIPGVTKASW